jgi:glutathione S-transferase
MNAAAPCPVLYSFRRCPYAMRARMALLVSRQTYELREVVLKNKPPELLQASPKATVPVLVLADGQVLDQSLDIMLWALQQHDPEQWLSDAEGRLAEMLAWVARCDGEFKHHLDRYKYPNRFGIDASEVHRAHGAVFLTDLNQVLSRQHHLMGDALSLPDVAIAPFVRQFAHTDTCWFAQQPWPALQQWLSCFESSALFGEIMKKSLPT